MPWYWFKRDGWEIAVDAVSRQDAGKLIAREAPGAKYLGQAEPPHNPNYSMASAFVTPKRQEIISETIRRENEAWEAAGRPGAWWDKP